MLNYILPSLSLLPWAVSSYLLFITLSFHLQLSSHLVALKSLHFLGSSLIEGIFNQLLCHSWGRRWAPILILSKLVVFGVYIHIILAFFTKKCVRIFFSFRIEHAKPFVTRSSLLCVHKLYVSTRDQNQRRNKGTSPWMSLYEFSIRVWSYNILATVW